MSNYCSNCGIELDEGVRFCPSCGEKIIKSDSANETGLNEKEDIVEDVKDNEIPKNNLNKFPKANQKKSFVQKFKDMSLLKKICACGGVLLILLVLSIILFGGSGSDVSHESITNDTLDFMNLSESEYKSQCQIIPFKQLNKNAEKYDGKKIKVTGEVLEIGEDDEGGYIRLDVNGNFGDTVFISYTGSNNVVEGDTITVYGCVAGDYTYDSQAHYTITLPWIWARYIE